MWMMVEYMMTVIGNQLISKPKIQMSLNSQRGEGHRFLNLPNNDLDQRLTYQQLLNLNHDLSKQNLILKNQTRRLGQQLRYLHSQFGINPREENAELYNAIGAHPILHQFEATLVPLLDAYQYKIQEFEHEFETVHEEFFSLEKKYEEVSKENQDLRMKLTDKIRELAEVYRNGGNEKMHSDFGQIILDQINEKQKALVQENALLQRDYQKYKSQAERSTSQLESVEKKLEESKSRLRELEINLKGLTTENASLKESCFENQIKINQIQAEKRKLEQAHERAESQNTQLNKEKDMYRNRLEQLKARIEKDTSIPMENDQSKFIEQLQTKIAFLEAEKGPDDYHKRMAKLQKDYDEMAKQKKRLKSTIESAKIKQDELNSAINDMKGEISKLTTEKQILEKNESRVNKSLETLTQKSKNDLIKAKKQSQQQLERLEFDYKHKLEMKEKKITQISQTLDNLKLERENLQKQITMHQNDPRPKVNKESDRALSKMKEKITITEQLFKEQLEILERDLAHMKKQCDASKQQEKEKSEQLKKLRQQYEQLKKQYEQVSSQKQTLIEQFRKVRNEYEIHLKQKQKQFEQKIKEIRYVIEQTENNRKKERQRVQQAMKQHKRVLQDIQSAYEARIRELENQVTHVEYIRKQVVTPMGR